MKQNKYSKCAVCGKEEKYPYWFKKGNKNLQKYICKNRCKTTDNKKDSKWQ